MRIVEAGYRIEDPVDGKAIMEKLERCARTCYKSEDRMSDGSAERLIMACIRRGHESILEHVSITVRVICDRGISHPVKTWLPHRIS